MSFRVPDGIDPKIRQTLQQIQGILYKLEKGSGKKSVAGSVQTVYQVSGGASSGGQQSSDALPGESTGDVTIHGDLFVDGTIHGISDAGLSDINPTFTDVTSSRSLGTVYQNTETTMKAVLISVKLSSGQEWLNAPVQDYVTIASGVATVTGTYSRIETEGGAATDDLDTIEVSGGLSSADYGKIIVVEAYSGDHDVVLKHGTGNLELPGSTDVTLTVQRDKIALIYTVNGWCALAPLADIA